MLRLKIFTTTCLLMAIGMFFGLPVVMAKKPLATATLLEKKSYLVVMLSYSSGLVVFLGGAIIGSLVLMRLNRKALREEAAANVQILIESTLASHKKKETEDDQPA